jgi:ribonuclease D
VIKPSYIDTQVALNELCQHYQSATILAIDTEFVRERTLHAALGLIQAFDGQRLALIDPLAIEDLTPFWALLTQPSITKVIHAGSEDFEVFKHNGNCVPTPIFDTQVAAALIGLGPSLGYAKLVQEFCEIELDKGESRTNWLARPLRDAQLEYAANDALYLYQLYQPLLERVKDAGRLAICLEESARLANRNITRPLMKKYLDVSNAWQLNTQQLSVLQQLTAWRFEKATERNMALGFVVKDIELFYLAKAMPVNKAQLYNVELLHPMVIKRYSKELLEIIDIGSKNEELPQALTRLIDYPQYKQKFKAIKSLIARAAEKSGIPPEMLASKKLIHEVLTQLWKAEGEQGEYAPILMSGWRKVLVEEELVKLLE